MLFWFGSLQNFYYKKNHHGMHYAKVSSLRLTPSISLRLNPLMRLAHESIIVFLEYSPLTLKDTCYYFSFSLNHKPSLSLYSLMPYSLSISKPMFTGDKLTWKLRWWHSLMLWIQRLCISLLLHWMSRPYFWYVNFWIFGCIFLLRITLRNNFGLFCNWVLNRT